MSNKDTPFDLFSSSKKASSRKPEKKAAAPAAQTETPIAYDPQTQQMLNQIKDMQDSIKSRLDYIAQKSGMKKEDVLQLINKLPGSKQEVEKMNANLKLFADKVWGAVGQGKLEEKTSLTEKQRKSKTLGSRRNWMKMP